MSLDHEFFAGFAARWIAAWNSRTTDNVLKLLHPAIVWDEQIFWPEVLQGRESVRAYVDAIWLAMPSYHVEEVQLFTAPADGRALVLFRQFGEAPAALGAGGGFEKNGCDIFLGFNEGLLSHYTATYDIVDMLRQLGALPPRRDLKGGAYLMSLTGRASRAAASTETGGRS